MPWSTPSTRASVVVAAAGNDGEEGNRPSYPAQYAKDIEGAIAVGAVDFAQRGRRTRT